MQNLSDLFPLGNAQCKKISAAYGKIFYTQAGVFCQQLFQAVFRRSPLCFTPFQHAVCLSGIICPFQRKQAAYLCLTKLCQETAHETWTVAERHIMMCHQRTDIVDACMVSVQPPQDLTGHLSAFLSVSVKVVDAVRSGKTAGRLSHIV